MAAKRSASSELNHENWDREEVPEEAGTFQRASDDLMKNRIIKTARRRNPISKAAEDVEKKSVFTSIAFTKTPTTSSQAFSFLSNLSSQTSASTSNSFESTGQKPQKEEKFSFSNNTSTTGKSTNYLSKLKGLNENVSRWIKQHVDANPFVNLQPIFDEYKKYFEEMENENEKGEQLEVEKKSEKSSSNNLFKSADDNKKNMYKTDMSFDGTTFGSLNTKPTGPSFGFSTTATSNTFSFVSNTGTTTASTHSSPQAFGSFSSNIQSNGFTFSAPVMTSSTIATTSDSGDKQEEDTPPKVEFTPVIEKDHIYTVRCKVFVKKDDKFGDRGVGNLFLKSIENSEKVQLIVRADTNLGNLLCNFILSENIPTQRLGKKDVMLVCLPTPDFKPPPVPILFRVKSPEEADNLLEILQKHKK